MPSVSFATFLIVCPTSFFLGILFSLFPYDYPVLWSAVPTTVAHFDLVEAHLKLLHNSPNLITRILHIICFLGLAGLIIKLYKPSESNMLFDGGSLILYVIAIIVYITNIVKGLRIVSDGTYGMFDMSKMTDAEKEAMNLGDFDPSEGQIVGREDNLKVLAASNTILALVLVGVLVLQAGQWYADRIDERELKRIRQEEELEAKSKKDGASLDRSSSGVKRKESGRESKKAR